MVALEDAIHVLQSLEKLKQMSLSLNFSLWDVLFNNLLFMD